MRCLLITFVDALCVYAISECYIMMKIFVGHERNRATLLIFCIHIVLLLIYNCVFTNDLWIVLECSTVSLLTVYIKTI